MALGSQARRGDPWDVSWQRVMKPQLGSSSPLRVGYCTPEHCVARLTVDFSFFLFSCFSV